MDVDGGAEFSDMDINELKDNMVLDSEGQSEMVEAAVKKCTCAKTLQERTDIGEFVRKKHLAKTTTAGVDGSITLSVDSGNAFETLKYMFDMSLHRDDNNQENEERETAFFVWALKNIEGWGITETNEDKHEITLKKFKHHKVKINRCIIRRVSMDVLCVS